MRRNTAETQNQQEQETDQACGEISLSCRVSGADADSEYSSPLIRMKGFVNGRQANLMIDSGSSSNFLSSSFVKRHQLSTVQLATGQTVQLADGSEYVVKQSVKNASVRWDGWSGRVTFLILPLSHYDVILGMKWLSENNPQIDWKAATCYSRQNRNDSIAISPPHLEQHQLSSVASADFPLADGRGTLHLISAKQWRREVRRGGECGC